jgi:hypothetical protein
MGKNHGDRGKIGLQKGIYAIYIKMHTDIYIKVHILCLCLEF